MTRREQELGYPDEFADRLELIWGAGFLSPGGPEEIRRILRNTDVQGKKVLEIGCGIAGPAIVIAGEFEAEQVIGVDIEPQLIERGKSNVTAAGLQDKIQLQLVEPGPLPFVEASFDVVFSKDAIVHIEDKLALYREVFRVLKVGGAFIAGDWFASQNADELPEFQQYRDLSHLVFSMQTGPQAQALIRNAGFEDVRLNDRNAWYAKFARNLVERIEGPLRDQLFEVCGQEGYERLVKVSHANAGAAECGGLRPVHIRATKPVSAS